MSNLPKGWIATDLDQICMIQVGRKDANEGNPFGQYDFFTCAAEPLKSDTYSFEGESIILPGNGANVGLVTYFNGQFEAYQRTYILNEFKIDGQFLYYFLKSYWKQSLEGKQYGSATNYIRLGNFKNFEVIIPPIAEQKRIVTKLDSLFAHTRRARQELDHIPKLIERYKQAILSAAFRGDLTADWRQKTNQVKLVIDCGLWPISSNWKWQKMSEICEHITKGTTPPKDRMYTTNMNKIPFVKVYNLTFNGSLDFSIEPTFVDVETHENFLKRSKVYPDDVLMNIVGPPLGKVSIVPKDFPEWNINQAIAIFRSKSIVFNKYILNYLIFNKTINWCIQHSKATSGQFNLTLKICQDIPIPIPSLEEQKEIVKRVEKSFQAIDRLEQEYQKAMKFLDRLEQSTLAKAFRGEIVPQDPNDEPASILLERIQKERENQPKPKKRQLSLFKEK
jgi:type I restriction enzyme, S subunit